MRASFNFHELVFKLPGGTSRGVLKTKPSWFLFIKDERTGQTGIGECSIIPKLSPDDISDLNQNMEIVCEHLNAGMSVPHHILSSNPALRFALEMAMLDLTMPGDQLLFDNDFINGQGIAINGLVWMGEKSFMLEQIKEKIELGYKCIKLKIAAINFNEELQILNFIRKEYKQDDLEIRLDANGGFESEEALEKLERLSEFDIHSIEQPIAVNQWETIRQLCLDSPIDIALDEELISRKGIGLKKEILMTISPQYIILKPSLLGGFQQSEEWIELAESMDIGWWVTSALESNIGLNAIAQWTYGLNNDMYQGLGTGQLFSNNIESPLYIDQGFLYYGKNNWRIKNIEL